LDAREKGLVDHLGSFDDAVKSAAKLAKLGDNFKVKYIRKGLSFKERLVARFLSKTTTRDDAPVTGLLAGQTMNPVTRVLQILAKHVEMLSRFNDPNGVYAYCMYTIE
jgi:protease-4